MCVKSVTLRVGKPWTPYWVQMGWFLASEQSMAATPTAPCHPVERTIQLVCTCRYIKLKELLLLLVHVHASSTCAWTLQLNWSSIYMEYMYYWYWNVPECIKCKKLSVTFHHLYGVISLCMIFAIQNSKLSNVHWKDSIKLSQVHVCDCYV